MHHHPALLPILLQPSTLCSPPLRARTQRPSPCSASISARSLTKIFSFLPLSPTDDISIASAVARKRMGSAAAQVAGWHPAIARSLGLLGPPHPAGLRVLRDKAEAAAGPVYRYMVRCRVLPRLARVLTWPGSCQVSSLMLQQAHHGLYQNGTSGHMGNRRLSSRSFLMPIIPTAPSKTEFKQVPVRPFGPPPPLQSTPV